MEICFISGGIFMTKWESKNTSVVDLTPEEEQYSVPFFTLFTSVMCMTLTLLRFSTGTQKDMKMGISAILYGSLAIYSLLIIISFVAIAGATLDRKGFLLIWLLFMVLVLVFEALAIVAQLIFLHPRNGMLEKWDIFNIVYYSLRTAVQLYSMVCVTIQYHALATGTGTREYFQKKKEAKNAAASREMGDEVEDGFPDSQENECDSLSNASLSGNPLRSCLLEYDPNLKTDTKEKLPENIAKTSADVEFTFEFTDDWKT